MSNPPPNVPDPKVPDPSVAPYAYPTGDPPKYTEAFPTPAYPPAGPPPGPHQTPFPAPVPGPQQMPGQAPFPGPQQMPGPAPVTGPQPMTTANYTTSQVAYTTATLFSEFPMQTVCPHCHESVTTNTSYINGLLLWLVVGTICVFGGFLGCCLIPFCVSSCKDVGHSCPQCSTYIGTFKRM